MPHAPAPAPPAELQPVNQPIPVQLVMNPPGPSNPAPHHGQPYAGKQNKCVNESYYCLKLGSPV